MPRSPQETAGVISKIFFCWLIKLVVLGSKRELNFADIYNVLPDDRSQTLGDTLEREWTDELRKCRIQSEKSKKQQTESSRLLPSNEPLQRPKLQRVLVKVFGWQFLSLGIVAIINECGIRILQPLLLGYLIRYFGGEFTQTEGYLFATGVILCSVWYVTQNHPYFFGLQHIAMRCRVGVSSLIYRKSLRLSIGALRETTIGQMVNILSNDMSRFDQAPLTIWYIVVGPLQLIIVTYILWGYYGYTCLVGVIFLFGFVPFQSLMGKHFGTLRQEVAVKTDSRIRIINEMITAIRVIKMFTWEEPFAKLAQESRQNEIKPLRNVVNLKQINFTLQDILARIVTFVILVTYVLLGNQLKAEAVFVTLALYNNVSLVLAHWFPSAIAALAEVLISIRRLEDFLLLEERNDCMLQSVTIPSSDFIGATGKKKGNVGISMRNIHAKWRPEQTDWTLKNISLELKKSQLIVIIGTVGSSKSSLLQAILKEVPISNGLLQVRGRIAYAAQEPWIFSGTVRENILFGNKYEPHWYKTVLDACALKRDLELLPNGDYSLVGDRGISLSGGQKARINLARAVYSDADVYLLDDPLSAVDAEVGKHLFENCIRGILRAKAVILVTHQLQFVKAADEVVLLNAGKTEIQGSWLEVHKSGKSFASLISQGRSENLGVSESALDAQELRTGSKTSFMQNLPADYENKQKGVEDKLITTSTSMLPHVTTSDLYTINSKDKNKNLQTSEIVEESRSVGNISLNMYWKFLRAGSGFGSFCVLLLTACLTQCLLTGSNYWLQFWTEIEDAKSNIVNSTFFTQRESSLFQVIVEDRNVQVGIYCGIIGALLLISILRTLTFMNICFRSSIVLHKRLFYGVLRSPMKFFELNPIGRILNRFSKDIGSIDEYLPFALFDTWDIPFQALGIFVVIAMMNPILIVPSILTIPFYAKARSYYVKTARSLKRLESISKSPVFMQMTSSFHGLTTIRAMRVEGEFAKKFDLLQDTHSSSWYLFIAMSRWIGLVVDWISILYIAIITYSFMLSDFHGSQVGLAVSSALTLTGFFQWGIRQSAECENYMVCVERVLEYADLQAEPPLKSTPDQAPPKTWPADGRIEFIHFYLKYNCDEIILKDINIRIMPKEKIGIVGRTGAGKSSLISALFRLLEPWRGSIEIDSIDIQTLGLHDLRSKISIIPQDPVLFMGSLRRNLDPFQEFQDYELWNVLDEVNLRSSIGELTGGLDAFISEGGTNFSVGERQLICLARAILRKNKILVLDEATANVDPETDMLIQKTIREKFENCTVLTVAHRLHTVIDSDKILVLDGGIVKEFDVAWTLLQNKNGAFYQLVQQTDTTTIAILLQMAENAYMGRYNSAENLQTIANSHQLFL